MNYNYYPASSQGGSSYNYDEQGAYSTTYPTAPVYSTDSRLGQYMDMSLPVTTSSAYPPYYATQPSITVQSPPPAQMTYSSPYTNYPYNQTTGIPVASTHYSDNSRISPIGSMTGSPVSPAYSGHSTSPAQSYSGDYSAYDQSSEQDGTSGERRYSCSYDMCAMKFKRRRDLTRHEASVHRNERMYVCDGTLSETDHRLKFCQCGRAFNRKDNLRNHLKPRTGRFSTDRLAASGDEGPSR